MLYGERVPFAKPSGREIIQDTLDCLVQVDAERIIISSEQPARMQQLVDRRSVAENNYKPIHITDGSQGMGTNMLAALFEYTLISGKLKPFSGNINSRRDYYRYIIDNPECLDMQIMASGCDLPLASPHKINSCISRYEEAVKNYGAEMTVLFTTKTYVNKVVNMLSHINPDFKDRFTRLDSTIVNYQRFTGKKARISNIFLLSPYRANREAYSIADDLYLFRYISKPGNWPKILNIIQEYKNKTDINKNSIGFVGSLIRLAFSSERLLNSHKKHLGNVLRLSNNILNYVSLGGCSAQDFCTCVKQATGLEGYIDFNAGFGTFIDWDDIETAELFRKDFPTIRAYLWELEQRL